LTNGKSATANLTVVYSHPARQQNVPQRPACALQMGLQPLFLTGLYFKPRAWPFSLVPILPKGLRERTLAQLSKRRVAGLPDERVISVSGVLPESVLRPLKLTGSLNLIHDWFASRWLLQHGHQKCGTAIFHGFQGSCTRSIAAARRAGMITGVEITQPLATFSVVPEERARLGLPVCQGRSPSQDTAEIRSADFIIVQSAWSTTGIRELRQRARIILLHLGVDTERFRPGLDHAPGFQAIFVGQLCVRKAIHHLLDAWRQLNVPGAKLLIVGAPTDELGCRLVREHINGVIWLGQVSAQRIAELYRQSDVFVGPSLSEGGFNAVYEAGASGLPCIVSDHAGSFVRDGEEGFIVRAGDVAGLSEKLNALGQNPDLRRRMGERARRRAEQLSWAGFGRRARI
jgi:glycosyltransferase involved in cell wall biosynthesis